MGKSARKAYLKLHTEDLSCALNSVSIDQSTDAIDITTFCSDEKQYIEGLDDGTISASGNWTEDLQAKLNTIKAEQKAEGKIEFEYAPLNATGKPVFRGYCIVTSRGISGDATDKISVDLSIQITGEVLVQAIS